MKLLSFTILLVAINITAHSQYKWKTFVHRNNNYTIDLPDFFTDGGITASGIHYYNTTFDENIGISVEGEGNGSSSKLTDYYLGAANQKGVMYKVFKPTWYVVSGLDSEGNYFYHKAILTKGNLYTLQISYPVTQKGLFDLILPRISKSFH